MINFKFGDKKINFDENKDYVRKFPEKSKHTGKELTDFEIDMKIKGEKKQAKFKDIIQNSTEEPIQRLDENENIIGEYTGKIRRTSFSGGHSPDTVYEMTIELLEQENINIDKLIIEDIETEPYEYTEKFNSIRNNDYLRIDTKISISNKEDFNKLKELIFHGDYFTVIRKGINKKSVNMRFGKVIWSQEENIKKIDFTLIEKKHDELSESTLGIYQPQIPNIEDNLAYKSKFLEELVELLKNKNLITEDEIDMIEDKVESSLIDEVFEYSQVDDIDNY